MGAMPLHILFKKWVGQNQIHPQLLSYQWLAGTHYTNVHKLHVPLLVAFHI